MQFQLNTRDDIKSLQQHFSQRKYVRVFDFLAPEHAQQLSSYVHQSATFTNAFFLNNQNVELTDEEIASYPGEKQRQLIGNIHQAAAQGVGFLYGRRKIEPVNEANIAPELAAVHQLMNSQALKDLIEKITGEDKIKFADAQLTRFRRGDFLTRHMDIVPGETRRFAYVIGLSPNWHPDWGGLLQFFERSGTPTYALSPAFNSLSLFDVSEVHSVTAVTPFAPQHRYSVTGWLRT